MALSHWKLTPMLAVLVSAGCKDGLHCEDLGGVEKDGACTCPAGTRSDEAGARCIADDSGSSGSPSASDGAMLGANADGGLSEPSKTFDGTIPSPGESKGEHDGGAGDAAAAPPSNPEDGPTSSMEGGALPDDDAGAVSKNCPPGACSPGGTCMSAANGDYSCSCSEGYTGTGTRGCADVDECGPAEAIGAGCSYDFPCVNVQGGYTCLGRFADWPIAAPGTQIQPSYSGDEDVLVDDVTGLSWQNRLPAVYPGCSGRSMTDPFESSPVEPPVGTTCTWAEADSYCKALELDGHNDWRLPSTIEHATLSESPLSGPPSWARAPRYWSSVRYGAMDRMCVEQSIGFYPERPDSHYYVRCVRGLGKNAAIAERYSVSSNDTEVTSHRAGLTWQRHASVDTLTLTEARSFCAALGARVPTLKEWATTLDPQAFASADASTPGAEALPLDSLSNEATYWSDYVYEAVGEDGAASIEIAFIWIPHNVNPLSISEPTERHYVRCVR